MGSLSNLYISQSYQSLIHLGTDNSASATLIQLQDGLGNNLGVALNTQGDISASGDLTTNTLRIELDTEMIEKSEYIEGQDYYNKFITFAL
jgi:hypothetical protein